MRLNPFSRKGGLEISVDREQYVLGDAVEVQVTVADAAEGEARVELFYRNRFATGALTQNVGDTPVTTRTQGHEEFVVASRVIAHAPGTGAYSSRLELPPAGPPSHSSVVDWFARAVLEGPAGKPIEKQLKLSVLAPPEAYASHLEIPPWSDSICHVAVEIDERTVLAGTAVFGTMIVTALEDFDAKEVHVSLDKWRQSAQRFGTGKQYAPVDATKAKLAGQTRFIAGQPQRFPFEIGFPQGSESRPSLESERSTIIWFVEGAAQLNWRSSYRGRVPLNVYNAPSR
jgi:hypothetical protein